MCGFLKWDEGERTHLVIYKCMDAFKDQHLLGLDYTYKEHTVIISVHCVIGFFSFHSLCPLIFLSQYGLFFKLHFKSKTNWTLSCLW